jgi:hypothetical protein
MTTRKLEQVPIRILPLASLRPSPENEQLYRPVSADDLDVQALADSIRAHGLKEPLVVTQDGYILSGHRRYVACQLAGLKAVPCRVEAVRRGDPEFLTLLREYNRQRVKSFDEVVREEVLSADPEEAYQALVEHRRQRARVKVDAITIEGRKHRARITDAKRPFLDAILHILEAYRDYWPLSVRQIHYYLLNDPPLIHANKTGSAYRNDKKSYKALDELATRARLCGRLPFEAIHDPTRPVVTWAVYRDPAPFLRSQFDDFLKGYFRDLQQSQPNHLEIVGEKNTIEGVVRPLAMEFCIPYTLGRGYSSLPPRRAMCQRFRKSGQEKLILLVLSDFDPEGEDIGHSFARSMRDDFGVEAIKPIKVALTARQVTKLRLPPLLKAKETSSRYAGFVEKHGESVWELEAAPPGELQTILRQAIDNVLDVNAFNAEQGREKEDAARLEVLRRRVRGVLGDLQDLQKQ